MKLEEATKEDLIYWIVSNGLEPDEEDFTETIKQYREAIYNEKMAELKQAYIMTIDTMNDIINKNKNQLPMEEIFVWQSNLNFLKNKMEMAKIKLKDFENLINGQKNKFELVE